MAWEESSVVLNVCSGCGEYRADKLIETAGPGRATAVCPACGFRMSFRQLPLLLVCGPSGAGKSAVLPTLIGSVDRAVLLELDVLWRAEFDRPETGYRDFFETWLRVACNIGQSGRPAVLFGAGCLPANIEPCVHRRYFSTTHYLALVCRDDVLAARLRNRPAWRKSSDEGFVRSQIAFNRWLIENAALAAPSLALLDTTNAAPDQTAVGVASWVASRLDLAG
jgi:hypothetical protein